MKKDEMNKESKDVQIARGEGVTSTDLLYYLIRKKRVAKSCSRLIFIYLCLRFIFKDKIVYKVLMFRLLEFFKLTLKFRYLYFRIEFLCLKINRAFLKIERFYIKLKFEISNFSLQFRYLITHGKLLH